MFTGLVSAIAAELFKVVSQQKGSINLICKEEVRIRNLTSFHANAFVDSV